MKKSIVLIAVFVFVLGTVGWSAVIPHGHTFEDIPISIKSSWYIGDSYNIWNVYPTKQGIELPSYDNGGIYLDLEITNHGSKSIDNIRAFYDYFVYEQDGQFNYPNSHYANLLWDSEVISQYERGTMPSVTLRSGETRSVRIHIANVSYPIDSTLEEYLDEHFNKIEVDFYVSWIHYTGIGGQWGWAFGIPNWELRYEFLPDGTFCVRDSDFDISAVTAKIDIVPYKR